MKLSELSFEENKLPSNIDLEYAIIGWIVMRNELLKSLDFIKADDFYSRQHADIFQAMMILLKSDSPITPFTIVNHLIRIGDFESMGGAHKYLIASLTQCHTSAAPIEDAKYLKQLSSRRKIIELCNEGIREANALNIPLDGQLKQITRRTAEIADDNPKKIFFDNVEVTERIIEALKRGDEPYSTGIAKLDLAMEGGLFPGKSYGIAGIKKMGKTVMAGSISKCLNDANVKHLFICAEMSKEEIHQRVLTRITDSFAKVFRSAYGKSSSFKAKLEEVKATANRATIYCDMPGLTFDDLKRICNAAIDKHGITGFILDYWQLVGGHSGKGNEAAHLDAVAQWIADFCRQKNLWSIVVAQINQNGNTRGSEGIRLSCDQVYQIHASGDDNSRSGRWIEMMDTRYTAWQNIGSDESPGLFLNTKGPYFSETIED